jgi:SAM-dependent methyltransferase
MIEFWESHFNNGGTTWGFEPADSAIDTSAIFKNNGFSTILIPGIGYGRNVNPFIEKGMAVTGIEISKTAVSLLNETFPQVKSYCGSVLEMPFSNEKYDGIYCYALVHLFNLNERKKIITECFRLLNETGMMIFCAISDESDLIEKGKKIGNNRYLMSNGLKVFFYSNTFIEKEFGKCGLVEYKDIEEPIKFAEGFPPMKFKMITCKKQ